MCTLNCCIIIDLVFSGANWLSGAYWAGLKVAALVELDCFQCDQNDCIY